MTDLRESILDLEELASLPFIAPFPYLPRRHPFQGLRSHIIGLHDPSDIEKENKGVLIDGLRHYPYSKPKKMLRIFRKRFETLDNLEFEFKSVKILSDYLAPSHIAPSQEFVVCYKGTPLLCGLQDYVDGTRYDPWRNKDDFLNAYGILPGLPQDERIEKANAQFSSFVSSVKRMMDERGLIPDLAGVGNMIFSNDGCLRLVDINNVLRVDYSSGIPLDSHSCPSLDLTIQALSLIEQKQLGKCDLGEGLYRHYLQPDRKKEVHSLLHSWEESLQD